jgi:hypothetical protein
MFFYGEFCVCYQVQIFKYVVIALFNCFVYGTVRAEPTLLFPESSQG